MVEFCCQKKSNECSNEKNVSNYSVLSLGALVVLLLATNFIILRKSQDVKKSFIPQASDLRLFRPDNVGMCSSKVQSASTDGRAGDLKFRNSSLENEALSSLHVALDFKKKGKAEKAKKLFQHAIALAPYHPDILTYYGEFLEDQDVIEAEHLYTKALMICPDHSKALVNRERTAPVVEELDQDHLNRLDEKRDLLMSIPEHSSALKRMKKEAYFLQIHHTAAIEGNTLSLAQTRTILETRMAVGGKSLQEQNEILGIDAALAYINTTLVNRIGDISVDDILEIHKRLMGFVDIQEAGRFRNTQVFIAEHVPPPPQEVEHLMHEFVNWLNLDETYKLHPIKLAALAHYKLVYIHPFIDGNGRSSRLLMNFILMRAGYPPVIIHKQDRHKYYEYLKTANEGDVRPFVRFIAKCAETILDAYLYSTTDLVSHDKKKSGRSKLPKTIIEE